MDGSIIVKVVTFNGDIMHLRLSRDGAAALWRTLGVELAYLPAEDTEQEG